MEAEDFRLDPKMRKQEVERRRRLRIASSLEKLKEIVQQGTGNDYRKADKVEILESTVKFLKDKQRAEHEESFYSGYNSCLVEISGRLMAATDIDFKSKSILLTLISKLSSGKQTPRASTTSSKPAAPRTLTYTREELKLPKHRAAADSEVAVRSPLTNINNVNNTNSKKEISEKQRGVKRSRSETLEKESSKKIKVEEEQQENVIRPTAAHVITKDLLQKQSTKHSNASPGKYSIETTNIAVIQKNADGKFTEISNIPLKSLLKNLQVLHKKDSKEHHHRHHHQKADKIKFPKAPMVISTTNHDIAQKHYTTLTTNREVDQLIGRRDDKEVQSTSQGECKELQSTNRGEGNKLCHSDSLEGFSYMKLLQEESIDPAEFLKSSTPVKSLECTLRRRDNLDSMSINQHRKILSLPPLSVFLNEQN